MRMTRYQWPPGCSSGSCRCPSHAPWEGAESLAAQLRLFFLVWGAGARCSFLSSICAPSPTAVCPTGPALEVCLPWRQELFSFSLSRLGPFIQSFKLGPKGSQASHQDDISPLYISDDLLMFRMGPPCPLPLPLSRPVPCAGPLFLKGCLHFQKESVPSPASLYRCLGYYSFLRALALSQDERNLFLSDVLQGSPLKRF